jgi:hypothetical protein
MLVAAVVVGCRAMPVQPRHFRIPACRTHKTCGRPHSCRGWCTYSGRSTKAPSSSAAGGFAGPVGDAIAWSSAQLQNCDRTVDRRRHGGDRRPPGFPHSITTKTRQTTSTEHFLCAASQRPTAAPFPSRTSCGCRRRRRTCARSRACRPCRCGTSIGTPAPGAPSYLPSRAAA